MQSTIIKNNSIKIDGFDQIRFSSDIDLPLGKLIEFKVLTIIIKCIIKKNDKYYPEIYLDECFYVKTFVHILVNFFSCYICIYIYI